MYTKIGSSECNSQTFSSWCQFLISGPLGPLGPVGPLGLSGHFWTFLVLWCFGALYYTHIDPTPTSTDKEMEGKVSTYFGPLGFANTPPFRRIPRKAS